MNNVAGLFDELRKFSPEVAEFAPPASPDSIERFEAAYHVRLPQDYKLTLAEINGFNVMGSEVYGVWGRTGAESLETTYDYEHHEVQAPQPAYLVPFSPDGRGNFYCFDTRLRTQDGASCPVVFWLSNYPYTAEDAPEVVNQTFVEFVNQVVVSWTLADYDYDGNERA